MHPNNFFAACIIAISNGTLNPSGGHRLPFKLFWAATHIKTINSFKRVILLFSFILHAYIIVLVR